MNTRLTVALIAGTFMVSAIGALAQNAPADGASMTCQQMMDKAKPMVQQMSDQSKMAKAEKEMTKAQTDMDAGKTKTCKMRMKKVMDMTR